VLRQGLARRGHEVVVLSVALGSRTDVSRDAGGTVVRVARFGRLVGHRLGPALPLWIRRLRPDLFHFHSPSPVCEIAALLARPRRPVVLTYHCDVERRGWHRLHDRLLQSLLGRAARIVVTSEEALESSSALRLHRGRCVVQPVGVDTGRLAETPRTRAVTAALRAARPGPMVLFVGRMHAYKGLHVLVEAMRRAPGTLVLVGGGWEEDGVRAHVREAGLADRVTFAGDVLEADLGGYYRAADVFVLPSVSRAEFFGQVLVEAMACGLPVISTRLGTGTSSVNRDGVTGLEVPPGEPAPLAAAITRLLEAPAERARLAAHGRVHAESFSPARMVAHTEALYAELLAGGRLSP
ncbi:MAG TPA: glycosyltransferase, partial [Candidatus Saccharimonadales bacterium]|nr:glycosyltransferase [Candidatus Saccharimonadales bacterium]